MGAAGRKGKAGARDRGVELGAWRAWRQREQHIHPRGPYLTTAKESDTHAIHGTFLAAAAAAATAAAATAAAVAASAFSPSSPSSDFAILVTPAFCSRSPLRAASSRDASIPCAALLDSFRRTPLLDPFKDDDDIEES